MPAQDPNDAPHLRFARNIESLERLIPILEGEHEKNPGNATIAHHLDLAKQDLKHTKDRLPLAQKVAPLIEKLGLSHEITPDTVTANDAANFIAKVLHEVQDGVTTSHYTRTHTVRDMVGKKLGELHPHKDPIHGESEDDKAAREHRHAAHVARMAAPFDPVADVVEHLGLTDEVHIAAVKALFAAPPAPTA